MRTISEISRLIIKYEKCLFTTFILAFLNFTAMAQRMENERATTEFNYDTRDAAWYTQPWIWAIVAAVLILFIAFVSKDYLRRHMENDSESGTTH